MFLEHNVRRFDVPVNNILILKIVDCLQQLFHYLTNCNITIQQHITLNIITKLSPTVEFTDYKIRF
jgi:hypothetical protein